MRRFSIGSGGSQFHFDVDSDGWVRASTRPDGSTPVIGGQFDLDHAVEVPADWSEQDEATGYITQIADEEEFYPGAGFDEPLVEGQVADVLWALRTATSAPTGRLLEVGCGPGLLLQTMARTPPGWSVHGVEPGTVNVARARARDLDVSHWIPRSSRRRGPLASRDHHGEPKLDPDPAATLTFLAAK